MIINKVPKIRLAILILIAGFSFTGVNGRTKCISTNKKRTPLARKVGILI